MFSKMLVGFVLSETGRFSFQFLLGKALSFPRLQPRDAEAIRVLDLRFALLGQTISASFEAEIWMLSDCFHPPLHKVKNHQVSDATVLHGV